MKIEVTAKEIKTLYDELNGIDWVLSRQAEGKTIGQDFSQFGLKLESLLCAGSHGISNQTKTELSDELTEVTKKFLEKRRKEIVTRFEELKLPIA
jgi:hypothetical protein